MTERDATAAELHLAVCRRFGDAVRAADGKWQRPSPCEGWNARDVVEHVIGFHDALLLRPLGLKPERPRTDPRRRWELTFDRLPVAFGPSQVLRRVVEVSAVGNNPAARREVKTLMPRLSQDVLVHTWDLARAVGADDRLDPDWCALFFEQLPSDPDALSASGMFAAPVAVGDDADIQSRHLARLGRDPAWVARFSGGTFAG
ncbi:hypothetical protein MXEN_01332 [Mycobacterium xenopi RIVM700367]|uniref:maleylpyruvate isomerase family mycothiol-dependent enzyme n=1 Tax=Mycobacterium xenopi TaxID=1789 RepID=UPI00025AD334|nr:maleylpyruvate isomerase family mycothiol-dependent enzyme [Mycobacterium xenopi]EID17349.1 hypothetical protein MXEN_01332 [Mycobacterium xenopi RIVM700367]